MNLPDLILILEKLLIATDSRSRDNLHSCFLFLNDYIQASDGNITIQANLPENLKCVFAVPAKDFLHLLKSLNSEEVSLSLGKSNLLVKSEKTSATLSVIEKFETECLVPTTEFDVFDKEQLSLFDKIKFLKQTVNPDPTSGILHGIIFANDKLYSTDRTRITRFLFENMFSSDNFSIPLKLINCLDPFKNEIYKVSISDNLILCETRDNILIQGSLYSGEIPNFDENFPDPDKEKDILIDEEIYSAMIRHIDFHKNENKLDRCIEINLNENLLTITSKNKNLGEVVDEICVENVHEDHFRLNSTCIDGIFPRKGKISHYPELNIFRVRNEDMDFITATKQ